MFERNDKHLTMQSQNYAMCRLKSLLIESHDLHAQSREKKTYLQNLNNIFSKTSTGPVLPRMVRGCPANRE